MPSDKLKNQIHLHFIVFIWGFTAILAALISIDALSLVWYRVLMASIILFFYLKFKKETFNEKPKDLFLFFLGGALIAVHWVTFFYAIKISTISTTLITMSSSAFFVVLLQAFFGNNKHSWIELVLAIVAIFGFVIIFKVEKLYTEGMIYALISAFLLAVFSLFNNNLTQHYKAVKIAFFELFFALLFVSVILFFKVTNFFSFFQLTESDWFYIFILGSICTAYPFVVATNLLKKMSPFTMVLTNNLEPVYGIVLAVIIFGDKEKMTVQFYLGAMFIVSSVLINAFLKTNRYKDKNN